MNKSISKKKLIILGFLIAILLFTIILSRFLISHRNIYKSDYQITYNEDSLISKDTIFSAIAALNLSSLDSNYIEYENVVPDNIYFNSLNKSALETKDEMTKFYGVENDLLKRYKDSEIVSISYFTNISTFPSQFEMIDNYFGIATGSEAANSSTVKVNYYNNENDYSLSLFNNEGDELIYVKYPEIKDLTYRESFNIFVSKFIENDEYHYFGEDISDTALFPVINIIVDSKINDKLISNYLLGARINISGIGEFNGNSQNIDKNNIKYNFDSNSILFIRKIGCENPYLIFPLN